MNIGLIKHKIAVFFLWFFSCMVEVQGSGFRHCGFYLHEGWFFNYPFAVRAWQRDDFANMFQLLQRMGYDQVGIWPMLESIPMPLSREDSLALQKFCHTVDDAHDASLECWLIQCANLTPDRSVASLPWSQRNPYHVWRQVRLDNSEQAAPYLEHRSKILSILNNADAYVTIDGDPGGYPEAKPEDWLRVFLSDRSALDKYGINPSRQKLIPWIWCGWGTRQVWGGNPNNPPSLIKPYTGATMELFKTAMPEPWDLLVGRSHRDNWANGRVNVELADSLGLISRTTIFCYEAIEFEPTPPAGILQFDAIRRILKEEAGYAGSASGIFGNAQQPIMVLPNIYFFARAANDLAYLKKPDEEILNDFAEFLGGPSVLLIPAWDCFRRPLETLPAELPQELRKIKLRGEAAAFIPGGVDRYLEILAQQAESRIRLLQSVAEPAASDEQAAQKITEGITALVNWWKIHGYVIDGDTNTPFSWDFVQDSQVEILRNWCRRNVKNMVSVSGQASKLLSENKILPEQEAVKRIKELLNR